MKMLRFLGILFLPVFVLVFVTGCPSPTGNNGGGGSGSFTYDGNTYPLAGAGVDVFADSFEISIVSSSINVPQWTGTGHIVWLDMTSPTTQGEPGTYDWAFTGGFELWNAGISFNYVADTNTGTWISDDWVTGFAVDYVTISVSGSIYTIEFSITMFGGQVATGSYTGPVTIW